MEQIKNLPASTFGRIPPQAVELEKTILGSIMLESRAFEIVSEILPADAFYKEAHTIVFEAMRNLFAKNSQIDLLTVVQELKSIGKLEAVGGAYFITQLTNEVVSSAHIETHARIILQKFIQREVIRIGSEMISSGYDDSNDVFDLLDETEEKVSGLSLNYLKNEYQHISASLTNVIKRIEHLKTLDSEITGVTSGYPKLDSITHGWQNTDLIILAARPSTGKTAFALNLARNAAKAGTGVGIFSLEMSADQLTQRILSAESSIYLKSIKTGNLDAGQTKVLHDRGVNPLFKAPIYIDDTAGITLFELRAKARRMKNKHKVGLIIVDYLQLMNGDKNDRRSYNREQEISKISRDLKGLAKSLNIPVIALSQLSREVEKRSNMMPKLSDLRESGAIEQDADIVSFLYRPSDGDVKANRLLEGTGQLNISKHRNGELKKISFNVYNNIQVWSEEDFISDDYVQKRVPSGTVFKLDKEDMPF